MDDLRVPPFQETSKWYLTFKQLFSLLQGAQEDTAAALDARECGAGCSAGRPTR
jgi:hypothetical protein